MRLPDAALRGALLRRRVSAAARDRFTTGTIEGTLVAINDWHDRKGKGRLESPGRSYDVSETLAGIRDAHKGQMASAVDVGEALRVAVVVATAHGCLDPIDLASVELALCRPGLAEDASQVWTRAFLPMLVEQVGRYDAAHIRRNGVPFGATSWRAIMRRAWKPDAKLAMGAECGFRIANDGVLFEWGVPQTPNTTATRTPTPLTFTAHKVTAIAVGRKHIIACDESGAVWTWETPEITRHSALVAALGPNWLEVMESHGTNESQLYTAASEPRRVLGFGVDDTYGFAVSVSAGVEHCAVVDAAGGCWVWGSNRHGQCGHYGSVSNVVPYPARVDLYQSQKIKVVQACCGKTSTTLLDESGVLWRCFSNAACIGSWAVRTTDDDASHERDERGMSTSHTTSASPCVRVFDVSSVVRAAAPVVTHVSMTHEHCIFIDRNGEAYGWGSSYDGATGVGAFAGFGFVGPLRAGALRTAGRLRRAVTSGHHSLVLATDGALFGFGANASHELDANGGVTASRPLLVSLNEKVTAVQCGTSFENTHRKVAVGASIAITENGTTMTWGAPLAWLGRGGGNELWARGNEPGTVRFGG